MENFVFKSSFKLVIGCRSLDTQSQYYDVIGLKSFVSKFRNKVLLSTTIKYSMIKLKMGIIAVKIGTRKM